MAPTGCSQQGIESTWVTGFVDERNQLWPTLWRNQAPVSLHQQLKALGFVELAANEDGEIVGIAASAVCANMQQGIYGRFFVQNLAQFRLLAILARIHDGVRLSVSNIAHSLASKLELSDKF
jgi:D-serine dehydratase